MDYISVVQIDVWDPTNGPKIFDSLNSRQEPMTIGDLVRNEIFSRVADKPPEEIEQIDNSYWQPFYNKFKQGEQNLFDPYFFPYGLIQNSNLKKSEVYGALRDDWKKFDSPKEIVEKLSEYQDSFIDLVCGTNAQKHSKGIAKLFGNLYRFKAPTSTYPFLMQLSRALQLNTVTEKDAIDSLQIIESFLIRRAICGHEPTGLHAVFKRLWNDCEGKPNKKSVISRIAKHSTVVWPNNEKFKEQIQERPLYKASITPYVLMEYDKSLGGDQPKDVPWVEHVLPENPAKQWFKVFSKEEHKAQKDLLANLLPLSDKMNPSVGNKEYSVKRKRYEEDSMFKSARSFAKSNDKWTPTAIKKRGSILADWAVKRWIY